MNDEEHAILQLDEYEVLKRINDSIKQQGIEEKYRHTLFYLGMLMDETKVADPLASIFGTGTSSIVNNELRKHSQQFDKMFEGGAGSKMKDWAGSATKQIKNMMEYGNQFQNIHLFNAGPTGYDSSTRIGKWYIMYSLISHMEPEEEEYMKDNFEITIPGIWEYICKLCDGEILDDNQNGLDIFDMEPDEDQVINDDEDEDNWDGRDSDYEEFVNGSDDDLWNGKDSNTD
jgi:hypothetical protein